MFGSINGLALISAVRTGAQAVCVGLMLGIVGNYGAAWGAVTAELGLTEGTTWSKCGHVCLPDCLDCRTDTGNDCSIFMERLRQ